jgi:hypothetical protein
MSFTDQILQPLLTALKLEGSYHLQKPCDSDHPAPHCPFYPTWPEQKKVGRWLSRGLVR